MGRPLRACQGGYVYHVLNRANGRLPLFHKDGDYHAFQSVLVEACAQVPMRVLSWCVLPNHWHLVLWPRADGELSRFVGWLTLTHTQRWHAHYHNVGTGHLYQGRFKSFPVQEDEHLLTVCRYVERNALRAGLVKRAEDWRSCSLWQRRAGTALAQAVLWEWPVPCPSSWLKEVNAAQTLGELEALRRCVRRGQPFGEEGWVETTVRRLGLEGTMRPPGRPRKVKQIDGNGS
ncbi:MAG TPA: transposase [Gemmataceae bacterium]|jgi:putative transposase